MAMAINAADRSLSFVIRFSPLDMKSQQRLATLWRWSGNRPFKVTITHLVSTPREGACRVSFDHERGAMSEVKLCCARSVPT